ncbi:MAG: hypothetical protein P9L92_00200 [Candidatus Electryonea clarkiae]|nr:hypothetical protein [Candidatus Electryonea clarkiae]MDP8286859.1 hypothetical protein [Candidatus Electryonea clarkiae]
MYKYISKKNIITLLTMMLFLTVVFIPGCETSSDDIPTGAPVTVEGLVEDGWSNYEEGNFQEAVTCFIEATNADAKNLEAYLGMGYAFAQRGELIRALQNFDNVIALSSVLEGADPDDGGISSSQANDLRAESNAGRAIAYLADGEFENAIDFADEALVLDNAFQHRWIADFDVTKLKLVKAEAYFGSGDYANCMYVLDDISGNFISGSTQIQEASDTVVVTLHQDTWNTGIAELELTNFNLIVPEVVVISGDDAHENMFDVVSFESTGNTLQFKANPIPQNGDTYVIEYKYASNFGEFLIELRVKIDALR